MAAWPTTALVSRSSNVAIRRTRACLLAAAAGAYCVLVTVTVDARAVHRLGTRLFTLAAPLDRGARFWEGEAPAEPLGSAGASPSLPGILDGHSAICCADEDVAEVAPEGAPAAWPMWGGAPARNMVAGAARDLPSTWDVETRTNIQWSARLGRNAHGNPVLAAGKLFVGTNNENPRDPKIVGDRGVLMCFRAADGAFLWQDTYAKLPDEKAHDWPLEGICSSPAVDGDRVFYLNNRAQVVCADTEGFADGENDGPFRAEERPEPGQADVVWRYDLIAQLGVSPCFVAASHPLVVGERVFVVTSNGVNPSTGKLEAPSAPSFIALDKQTGKLLWQQGSVTAPSRAHRTVTMPTILEGQWGSPSYAHVTAKDGSGLDEVFFPGGDGWLYALRPDDGALVWKFDCNPKAAKWLPGGRGDRNYLVATPVAVENRVYIAVGQDPEYGGGPGHLYAIDATGRGDVTPTHALWHRQGKEFGRSISTVAVHGGVVYAAELDGFLHALDAKTGEALWQYDMLSQVWGSPLVADGKVYLADEDGDVVVFAAGREQQVLSENSLGDAVYGTPIAAGRILYIATRGELFAIEQQPGDN